jgi:chromate transport protein ChrA
MEMDMKTIVFLIAFVTAGALALLGVYAIAYQGASITSAKTSMDFIFAAIIGVLAIAQYKIIETAEKS